jgi:integrase/recombinase XerD
MTTHNPNNERIKRQYFAYLKEAKRHSEPTVDATRKAIARFEADTQHRDFKSFHFEQAVAFKRRLAEQRAASTTGEKLSKATLHATLAHRQSAFFHWLADAAGVQVASFSIQRRRLFQPVGKGLRVATARREQVPRRRWSRCRHVIAT